MENSYRSDATVTALRDWLESSPYSRLDLARYRVFFALAGLATLVSLDWMSELPPTLLNPAPGPFMLVTSVPPMWVLTGLELALAAALALLLFDQWTLAVSWITSFLLLATFGLSYSFGKVDHSILLIIVPALLSRVWSGHSRSDMSELTTAQRVDNLPLRLLAIAVGVSFAYAGLEKAAFGWLSPRSPAALGYILQHQATLGGESPLVGLAVATAESPLWEALDWVVILLECGVLIAALSWRLFRATLAILAIFHLTVMLTMGIQFGWNIVVYGAFVFWSRLPTPAWIAATRNRWVNANRTLVLGMAALVMVAAWALSTWLGPALQRRALPLIVAGAIVGVCYLVVESGKLFARART